jgi:hypothetical protein
VAQLYKYSSYKAETALAECVTEGDVVLVYPGIHEQHIWREAWKTGFELYGVSFYEE